MSGFPDLLIIMARKLRDCKKEAILNHFLHALETSSGRISPSKIRDVTIRMHKAFSYTCLNNMVKEANMNAHMLLVLFYLKFSHIVSAEQVV